MGFVEKVEAHLGFRETFNHGTSTCRRAVICASGDTRIRRGERGSNRPVAVHKGRPCMNGRESGLWPNEWAAPIASFREKRAGTAFTGANSL